MPDIAPNVAVFSRDAEISGHYTYNDTSRLSSRLACRRWRELVLATGCLAGTRVLDIGCGDASHTVFYHDQAAPRAVVAFDAAVGAVRAGAAGAGARPIRFAVASAHHLPFVDDAFDVALIQAMLHHDDQVLVTLREALRVARRLVILEPNACNPGLKVLEKVSRYHREHGEKSYPVWRVRHWIEEAGGRVVAGSFGGFVPMFCPDVVARGMKWVEPLVEGLPGLRELGCAIYVLVAERAAGRAVC